MKVLNIIDPPLRLIELELISKETKLWESFNELTSNSTPSSPILFLLKFNIAILSELNRIFVKKIIELIPKKLSDKSETLFMHLRLQKSLNLYNILILNEIPKSLHLDLQKDKISSSLNIGIFIFKVW